MSSTATSSQSTIPVEGDLKTATESSGSSPSAPAKSGRMRTFIFALFLIAGLVWTFRYAQRLITHAETDNAYITGHLHQVSPRIAGTIEAVLVEENTRVEAGQPLVKLDPRDADSKVLQAKALLAVADTQIAKSQADLVEKQARVAQAEAQMEKAQLDFQRAEELTHTKVASKQEYDTAKAALDSAKAGLDSAKANTTASQAALDAAQAQRQAGVVYLEDAELQRSYCTVTAPVSGIIGKRNAEIGNRAQAGQALFAIMEPDVWIVANFKETQLAKMTEGQDVEITIDAIPGAHFAGKVESFSPASGSSFALLPADNATGNFTKVVQRVPVRIHFDAASVHGYEAKLRAGLSAVVAVKVD